MRRSFRARIGAQQVEGVINNIGKSFLIEFWILSFNIIIAFAAIVV
jgi:hypothetical protein